MMCSFLLFVGCGERSIVVNSVVSTLYCTACTGTMYYVLYIHHFAVYSLLYNIWSSYMYSVSTKQVSTQAVNGFIKILILKGKNTGEI